MKTTDNRGGFSMIEMLVAAAILTVLVMMLAMIFQGTSQAWRIGVKRAEGYMHIRSVLGAIQRDASAAIDERSVDEELRNALGGNQSFSGSSLSFFTLTGTGENPVAMRALTHVRYTSSGDRTETKLDAKGGSKPENSNVQDFVVRAGNKNQAVTKIENFTPVYGEDKNGLPLFVTIKARVTTAGYSLDIGAASAGPDKAWNTKDDIRTWVK